MTRSQLGSGVLVALGLLTVTARADAPNQPDADPAEALIDKLTELSEQDTGYSESVSGTAFFPLGRRESYSMLLGQRLHVTSDTMRSLVRLGVKSIPALLSHLSDDRKTKIVVEHAGVFGGLFVTQDKGEKAEEELGEGLNSRTRYTVRVGDLCYVALGQIVNRSYMAARYQPTAIVRVTCVPKSKQLREELKKEWGGLTADRHREILTKDLASDPNTARIGASVRLAYYYPAVFEQLALEQLARPTYRVSAVANLIRKDLYPAASAKDRKELVDEFVKQHGEIARDGILWNLFDDLDTQEAAEQGRVSAKLDPKYKARECLIDVFGLAASVKSKDRPKVEPLSDGAQSRFVRTLVYDPGKELDQAIRKVLTKTDNDYLAEGCINRLVGRGYDTDIETYINRHQPLPGRRRGPINLEAYREKLGWNRLQAAVDLDVPEMIAAALKEKIDVNARDNSGRTALYLAAVDDKAGAVEMLLKAKADPNAKDNYGRTPLDVAKLLSHEKVIKLLEDAQ